MTITAPFDNSYAALPEGFYSRINPTPVANPRLLAFNEPLASSLGFEFDTRDDLAFTLGGNELPVGADPLAQLYAGHQFGSYNPQLGDGRAILLGEVVDRSGKRRDIQLKGSGRTPYSRGGDGRAWLGPVLREYVVSEAMHALGIPTTRALAAVATGEEVYRETALPGAVLTRVASSHLRVGTFQVYAHRGEIENLRLLTQYAIERHYPDTDGPMGLLRAVFSSIDRQGRYAFSNQPQIAVWNMAQLANALLPLLDNSDAAVGEATEIVHAMSDQVESAWRNRFAAKIGIISPSKDDGTLIDDLLLLMQKDGADFTNTFRALSGDDAVAQFTDRAGFAAWQEKWQARIATEDNPEAVMNSANPVIIPRNHRIEEMIQAAVAGDMAPFNRLMNALASPFTPTDPDLHRPPSQDEIVPATFCGT